MKISIRSKLIAAISLLVVVLFSLSAYLFITEKKTELADDIHFNTLAFSKLTGPKIAENYDLFLAQGAFVYFNREMQTLFEQNDDVSEILVVDYEGDVLYSSIEDREKRYEGDVRNFAYLDLIKSENVAIRTLDGRVVYLKDGSYVDLFEKSVQPLESGALLEFIAVPASENYFVVYSLDYSNLEQRVGAMMRRIIYLALFGIMLGMIMSFFMSGKVTRPVLKLVKGAEGIAAGNFDTQVDIKSSDEIGYLGGAFNKMAKDLKASLEAKLYKERVASELKLAREIQERLIPEKIPEIEGLDIAADLTPAGEIGGDMYDFLPISDKRLLMYLGDVTGHGVPAGIISSIASALFFGFSSRVDLKDIMVKVNTVLKAKTMPNMFMTLCLMEWNVDEGFKYVSAGHEQIIHYKAAEKKAVLLPSGGMALGMIPDVSKVTKSVDVDLAGGDFLVVYSDGIPECWKSKTELYGMERFVATVQKCGGLGGAAAIKDAILKDVRDFAAGHEQMDDITIMVLKKK